MSSTLRKIILLLRIYVLDTTYILENFQQFTFFLSEELFELIEIIFLYFK